MCGAKLTEQELKEMIQEADKDGHKEVDQEEFVNIMLKIVQLTMEILESLFNSTTILLVCDGLSHNNVRCYNIIIIIGLKNEVVRTIVCSC